MNSEVYEKLSGAELRLAYQASVVKLAKGILDDFVVEMEPSAERDKLAGLAGIMEIMHDDLLNIWSDLGRITLKMNVGKLVISEAGAAAGEGPGARA